MDIDIRLCRANYLKKCFKSLIKCESAIKLLSASETHQDRTADMGRLTQKIARLIYLIKNFISQSEIVGIAGLKSHYGLSKGTFPFSPRSSWGRIPLSASLLSSAPHTPYSRPPAAAHLVCWSFSCSRYIYPLP